MKKAGFILTALLAMFISKSVNSQLEKGPKIEFLKEVHDYGQIKQDADGTCTFEFVNTGNEPLVIAKAVKTCGCTVPSWPKEPIPPGGKGVITVKYNTNHLGAIAKSVTIVSNAINDPNKILRIKGTVITAP